MAQGDGEMARTFWLTAQKHSAAGVDAHDTHLQYRAYTPGKALPLGLAPPFASFSLCISCLLRMMNGKGVSTQSGGDYS